MYNAQVHRSTSLPTFSLEQSQQPPGPTKVDNSTVLLTEATAKVSIHDPQARLLPRLSTMRKYTSKRTRTVQSSYKGDKDRRIRSAPKKIEIGQYGYLDRPPMIISAAELLSSESYKKMLWVKMGQLT